VQVGIAAETRDRAVIVPATAVIREGEDMVVFVVNGGKAERRAVTTGLEAGDRIEISKGLVAGDVVITAGQNGLPDGAPVTVGSGKDRRDSQAPEAEAQTPERRP
jgi:membrane fusion protein (multidrug efflux system)